MVLTRVYGLDRLIELLDRDAGKKEGKPAGF